MKQKKKIKEYIKILKELWLIPRYRAIIKLSLYGIMFLFLIVLTRLSNKINTTEQKSDERNSYTEIIKSINLENADIKYTLKINELIYTLEGKIEDNIISGYLDNNNEIKKIIIKENNIYEVKNSEQILNEEINNTIDYKLLFPKTIIDLVKNESAFIKKGIEETTYIFETYDNNIKYEIMIFMNSEEITKISIINDKLECNMSINFDKLS